MSTFDLLSSLWHFLSNLTSWLWFIINTQFFAVLATIFVGWKAYSIYAQQKEDQKRDAANIIFLEITNAERAIKQIRKSLRDGVLPVEPLSMQTESWSKYKYLFVRDFDRNEWDAISDFYNSCQSLDQAISYNSSFFQKNEEQVRVNLQRIVADYAKAYAEKKLQEKNPQKIEKLEREFTDQYTQFQAMYMGINLRNTQDTPFYSPVKPINDAKAYVENLSIALSTTSIGSKFKEIAHIDVE